MVPISTVEWCPSSKAVPKHRCNASMAGRVSGPRLMTSLPGQSAIMIAVLCAIADFRSKFGVIVVVEIFEKSAL